MFYKDDEFISKINMMEKDNPHQKAGETIIFCVVGTIYEVVECKKEYHDENV